MYNKSKLVNLAGVIYYFKYGLVVTVIKDDSR